MRVQAVHRSSSVARPMRDRTCASRTQSSIHNLIQNKAEDRGEGREK
jgi:hypothetical protein